MSEVPAQLDKIKLKPASVRRLSPAPANHAQMNAAIDWALLRRRIRGEFEEMPGLSLTLPQASRLLGLPETTCNQVLGDLVDEGVLRQRSDRRFVLRTDAA